MPATTSRAEMSALVRFADSLGTSEDVAPKRQTAKCDPVCALSGLTLYCVLLVAAAAFPGWRVKMALMAPTALLQSFALAAERFAYRRRDDPDPSRAAHILVDDQPRSSTCRRFIGPNAD